jgi:hypothetical protein
MNPSLSEKMLVIAAVLVTTLVPSMAAQGKNEKSCGGLHAAISVELVRRDPAHTQPPFVMLTYILPNDSVPKSHDNTKGAPEAVTAFFCVPGPTFPIKAFLRG